MGGGSMITIVIKVNMDILILILILKKITTKNSHTAVEREKR